MLTNGPSACRIGLQDVTAGATSTSRTGSYWRWLSSGMLSTYLMTAAGQALWGPGQPDDGGGGVSAECRARAAVTFAALRLS
jgi:hypothetical protein